jgi:hypothetical protein
MENLTQPEAELLRGGLREGMKWEAGPYLTDPENPALGKKD